MSIIGTVDLRDVDLACFTTIDATVATYTIDGDVRGQYVVDIDRLDSGIERFDGKVPVYIDSSEDTHQDFVLPCFVFKRNSMTPAFDRHPYACTVARAPARDATPIYDGDEIVGYSSYVNQVRADQYDFSFDLNIYARRGASSNLLVGHVMNRFRPPWFSFKVIDSIGDVREYDAGDVSYSNMSELADIADRTVAWTCSFTARVEIDTFDDIASPAMYDPRVSLQSTG